MDTLPRLSEQASKASSPGAAAGAGTTCASACSTRSAAVSNTKSHAAWPVSTARRHLARRAARGAQRTQRAWRASGLTSVFGRRGQCLPRQCLCVHPSSHASQLFAAPRSPACNQRADRCPGGKCRAAQARPRPCCVQRGRARAGSALAVERKVLRGHGACPARCRVCKRVAGREAGPARGARKAGAARRVPVRRQLRADRGRLRG